MFLVSLRSLKNLGCQTNSLLVLFVVQLVRHCISKGCRN